LTTGSDLRRPDSLGESTAAPAPVQRVARLPKYIPELDGVRGIAILLVLLFHFGTSTRPGGILGQVLGLGWVGVDLFFVLSGFLITGILLNSKGLPHYFSSFYIRRVLRIFPLYYFSVFVFFNVALPIAHNFNGLAHVVQPVQIWYWLYLVNWYVGFGNPASPLTHFWSLCIEEQFYMVWPLLIFVIGRKTFLRVCIALIVLSPVLRFVFGQNPPSPYFLYFITPFRMEPIALGAVIAILWRQDRISRLTNLAMRWVWIPALAVVAYICVASGTTIPVSYYMERVGYTCIGLAFMSLVFVVAQAARGGTPIALLRYPVLMKFGKYSYAMYVFHAPISQYLPKFLHFGSRLTRVGLSIGIGVGLTYVIAVLSWRYIESPILSLKGRFGAG
jgi:peptidoglycan/LPS O-acetylase OafA/YrhL